MMVVVMLCWAGSCSPEVVLVSLEALFWCRWMMMLRLSPMVSVLGVLGLSGWGSGRGDLVEVVR